MKKKFVMALILVVGSICFSSIGAKASAIKPENINSQGKIVFDNGTEDAEDDVIFDADDIYYLYSICR